MAPRQAAGTRIRYRRLVALTGSAGVTAVAVLGGLGALPQGADARLASGQATLTAAAPATPAPATPAGDGGAAEPEPVGAGASPGAPSEARFGRADSARRQLAAAARQVPPDSGEGRRVVFDLDAQRVWLVGRSGAVRRTYLASGSVTDNLSPGSYEVYSRSERAWGIDDSGTMRYMVRFTRGDRAAIGFHDIPVKDGRRVQGRDDLGRPMSHGCIRQWRPDAKALWEFAPVGTSVVVV